MADFTISIDREMLYNITVFVEETTKKGKKYDCF